jgi:hypothetical protein
MVRERIRDFFLNPSSYYTISTAAQLLGTTVAALRREAESDWRRPRRMTVRSATALAKVHHLPMQPSVERRALRTVTVTLPEFIVRAMNGAAPAGLPAGVPVPRSIQTLCAAS